MGNEVVKNYTFNLADMPDQWNISPGTYPARLVELNEAISSSGHKMLVWEWEITDSDFSGQTIRSYTSLQQRALPILKQHFLAFGLTGEVDLGNEELVGKSVCLVIGERIISDQNTGENKKVDFVMKILPAETYHQLKAKNK